MSSKRIEIIKTELERIRKAHGGRLTPAAVVKAARDKKSPLWREFDWNDARMANKAREDVARDLIVNYITVVVVHKSLKVSCPFYVRDPDATTKEAGYVAINSESLNRSHAQKIVLAELDRCESAIVRARNIAGVLDVKFSGLSDQLEDLLSGIVHVRRSLAAE